MNQSAQAFYAAREFLLSPPRGLRHGLPRLPLARDRRVQLGARPLRRRRRRPERGDAAGAVDRRAGRVGGALDLRRAVGAVQPGGQLAARAGRRPRRPGDPDARQPGRAVGDAARGDEARRGGHPGHHAADGGRPARPAGPGQRQARRRRRGGRGQVRRRRRRLHADRRAGRARGLARLRRRRRRSRRRSPPTASPTAPTPCCSTSPPAPRRSPSSSSTRTRPTRSGTCPRCTGSGWSRATSTSTSPRRAGRSTRGATSSRRGSPRRACSS